MIYFLMIYLALDIGYAVDKTQMLSLAACEAEAIRVNEAIYAKKKLGKERPAKIRAWCEGIKGAAK